MEVFRLSIGCAHPHTIPKIKRFLFDSHAFIKMKYQWQRHRHPSALFCSLALRKFILRVSTMAKCQIRILCV